ncbi:MAG: LysE family translocator [Proteobacteria bacterium]|nr:LysE family translocator [Pseudomonadota bacterium]
MTVDQLVTFLLVSVVFIALPGPNVLVIVSTSLLAGNVRGLQTVAGICLAMIIQLIVAAVGTNWFLSSLTEGLYWLKWLGAIYLLFIGINALYHFFRKTSTPSPSALGSMQRGFWVSLTNPKTILFFSAFLPQFVVANASYLPQIAFLSMCFWILAVIIDATYAVLAAKAKRLLVKYDIDRIQNGVSGTLYVTASGILASTNKV